MIRPAPITLEGNGVKLEPLSHLHEEQLASAAADGRLWELWFTSVPAPAQTGVYIEKALEGQRSGDMLPWAVRELKGGQVIGSTRYHDIIAAADRVEIACKLLLFAHAFEALGCKVVGLRTDNFNLASQRAIEALGAKKDGVIRHHWPRRDGTVRDTVMYSVLATEWPDVKRHLQFRLKRNEAN